MVYHALIKTYNIINHKIILCVFLWEFVNKLALFDMFRLFTIIYNLCKFRVKILRILKIRESSYKLLKSIFQYLFPIPYHQQNITKLSKIFLYLNLITSIYKEYFHLLSIKKKKKTNKKKKKCVLKHNAFHDMVESYAFFRF